ncbi:hypothetical protein D3C83_293800 [compost metagenome]
MWARSRSDGGVFQRKYGIAPIVLKLVASASITCCQKRVAEKRSTKAARAPTSIAG